MKKKTKIVLPTSLGVAAVWFGSHVGPGTASGNQTASYFGGYGKLGFVGALIAMAIMGLCIYYSLEYSRLIGTTSFKEFADSFFHPHEKIFSTVFEFAFMYMVVMNFSSSLATGATAIENQFHIPYWCGMVLLCLITIAFTMFGTEMVRKSSTVLTVLILAALCTLLVCGLTSSESSFLAHWNNTMVLPETYVTKPWYDMLLSAVLYAGFLSVGMMGNTLAVSDSLKSKKDSRNATCLGILLNVGLIFMVAILLYAYPSVMGEYFNPARTSKSFVPNLEIVNIIGKPILVYFYFFILIGAIISTLEGYGCGVISRYRQYIPVKNERIKDLLLLLILLVVGVALSGLGLDWIISKGFRFIGYVELIFIVIPTIAIGHKKIKEYSK